MIRSRFSLLGVLVAVGVTALFASSAQAETGAKWLILSTPGGSLESGATFEAETFELELENKTASFLATELGIPLEVLCTAAQLLNSHPRANGSTEKGSWMKFTGCVALNATTKAKLTNCNIKSSGQPVGTFITSGLHTLLELHVLGNGEKHDIFLILPDNEATNEFANVEMGEGCSVGENIPIKGDLALWDCVSNTKWLEHNTVHLMSEFKPLNTLKGGNQPATLDGSLSLKLASGRQFAGDPA